MYFYKYYDNLSIMKNIGNTSLSLFLFYNRIFLQIIKEFFTLNINHYNKAISIFKVTNKIKGPCK